MTRWSAQIVGRRVLILVSIHRPRSVLTIAVSRDNDQLPPNTIHDQRPTIDDLFAFRQQW